MAGLGALDTPRTNLGDATYLNGQHDLDLSEEVSFQSPSKDANVLQQLRNGGKASSLRTPRGNKRAPFSERHNLPAGIAGPEFTPLLKSATRRSAARRRGKENVASTPTGLLARIDEDLSPIPTVDNSVFGASRGTPSFVGRTPVPQVDSDSTVTTPMVMKRRNMGKSPLHDKNQLSLREQEGVIDRIEKENFGLKLKIHFLEEALRKAGPGFSEAALKENTELKVDKVTMQRDLQRYKKHLTSAEKDLENYRQQILEMQDKFRKRHATEDQRVELERLKLALEAKEADVADLQQRLDQSQRENDKAEKLQDEIGDLEADVREKDRIISQHEDELEDLNLRVQTAEDKAKDSQRRIVELEEKARASSKLQEANDAIEDLEADVRKLENQVEELKDKLQDAVDAKDRAEGDLEELQEEMANKSVVTKGLSRQVEEKLARLQDEVEDAHTKYAALEKRFDAKGHEVDDMKLKLKESRQEREAIDRERRSLAAEAQELQADLRATSDQKSLLQTRHDALTNESASLQRDVARLQREVSTLEAAVEQERQHALQIERSVQNQSKGEASRFKGEVAELRARLEEAEEERQRTIQSERNSRDQLKDEIERLKDEISDLQAEMREKDNMYDNDSEKWETEMHNLEAERDQARERAEGLQRTIEKLRDVEGALSSKEFKLQQAMDSEAQRHTKEAAVLERQIDDLQQDLEARQGMLEDLRRELSTVRDELRQARLDHQTEVDKVEGLEDEIEVLQTTLDEESERAAEEVEQARRECDDLKQQLKTLQAAVADSTRKQTSVSHEVAKHNAEHLERLKAQLAESTAKFTRATKEKQALQDQLASLDIDMYSLRASLAEAKAERDELEGEVRLAKLQGADTAKMDQERIELRTTKTKLDNEVRRLREENKSLAVRFTEVEAQLEQANQNDNDDTFRLDQERITLRTAKTKLDGEVRRLKEENKTLAARLREVEAELSMARQQGEQTVQLEQQRGDIVAAKAKLESELRRLKEDNMVLAAERAEIEEELLLLSKQRGDHTFELDQERINLRVAKTKLDNEVRRLKEENRQLAEHRLEVERRFDEEMDKAVTEEERLTHEMLQLQAKLRQSGDNQALTAARRKIRELERRVDDYEAQLAILGDGHNIEGNSDLSILRKDLTSARQKERDFAEREAAHKSTVRDLKRQISDLERMMHDAEMSRLLMSPATVEASTPAAGRSKMEATQLRNQLGLAHQVGQDLKKALREAERKSSTVREELQARIDELEDRSAALEQQLEDARAAAEEAAAAAQTTLAKYKTKLERYRRERDQYAAALEQQMQDNTNTASTAATEVTTEERRDLHALLRKAQLEAAAFERDVREQKTLVDELSKAQESLRMKLQRVRGERAAYRSEAEKMRRELGQLEVGNAELTKARDEAESAIVAHALLLAAREAELARLAGGRVPRGTPARGTAGGRG
ncbi:tropomyosin-1 alpha chain [Gaeumannomyces tritici R3-111a-1]|uniref:Tropomyosin-1 alpha chain n=1 Tax=Gaeumannomyces tritici (strain R3-111a-1) TaxID=644352 RepID=J3NV88_GAET3|nr:tropomyosin-1 alpha chain [Gaeumannomyces tritici R3-111a-1]EJT75264.1 tropomyosin-1 alpha chain [Gaeumannomyces tritici R3-111a-1]